MKNMTKLSILFVLLLIICCSLSAVSAANNTTVNNGTNEYSLELSTSTEDSVDLKSNELISENNQENDNSEYDESNYLKVANENDIDSLGITAEFTTIISNNYYGSSCSIAVEVHTKSGAYLSGITLKLKVDDETYKKSCVSGKEVFLINDLSLGQHTFEVSSPTIGVHGKLKGTFNIVKAPSKMDLTISNSNYGENNEITVSLKTLRNNIYIPTTGMVNVNIDDNNYVVNVINGIGTYTISGMNVGVHKAAGYYDGTVYDQTCSASTQFNVKKADPNLSLYVQNVTYGKPSIIIVNLYGINNEPLNGNTTVTINNKNYTFEIINGVGKRSDIYITDGEFAYVYWEGNNNYNSQTNQTSYTIGTAHANLNIEVTDSYYGENNRIAVKLTGFDSTPLNGTVMVYINHKNYQVVVNNGVGTKVISSLDAGMYNVGAIWFGNKHYANVTAITTFTVYKINPTLDILVNNNVYGIGSNITVKLNGLNGEGLNETVIVSISEKDYVVLVKDGIGTIQTEILPADTYLVTTTFEGNTNYLTQSKVNTFKVEKAIPTINTGIDNSTYGDDICLTINLYNNVTYSPIEGNVLVIIGGKSYNIYVPKEGIDVNLTGDYPAGVNDFEVIFNGNNNYTENTFYGEFNVNKSIYIFDVNVKYSTFGENVLMTINIYSNNTLKAVSSDVILVINGKSFNIHVPEKGLVINLTNYVNGDINYYSIIFNGNSNYNKTSYLGNFSLNKATATLNIIANDVNYGEKAVIGIELYGNEPISDTVNLTVNNKVYTVNVVNGKGVINLGILSEGGYLANAYWNGNENYLNQSSYATFTVGSSKSYLNIIVSDSIYGENATVTVKLTTDEPITDDVTVTIDNKKYTVNLINGIGKTEISGLNVGSYVANAYWAGNGNYSSTTASFKFNVEKASPYLEISIKNTTTTEGIAYIKLYGINNEPLIGIVSVTIGTEKYAIYVVEGEGKGNVNLTQGATATAKWSGNDNYNSQINTTSYNIGTTNVNLNIIVNNITYGNNINITVTLIDEDGNDVSGNVTLNIRNNNYFVNVIDGEGKITIADLPAGNYTIEGFYLGNEIYAKANNTVNFTIYKAKVNLNVNINNVTYGNTTIINVNLTGSKGEPISGEVKIEINGKTYTLYIENDIGTLELKLNAGDYSINVIYDGDKNYNNQTQKYEFKVNPVNNTIIKVDIKPMILQHKIILTVYLYDPYSLTSFEGNVTIKINDKTYNLTVKEGGSVLIMENVFHGGLNNYSITFEGNQNYNKTMKSGNFTIPKITPQLNVEISDSIYGQNNNITVYLTSGTQNLNGEVIITIDGIDYTINVKNGVGVGVTNILGANSYIAKAYYKENENFTEQEAITSFKVNKKSTILDINVNDSVYNEPIYIDISLFDIDSNALSGDVFISIDDKKYYVNVTDGKGNLTINEPLSAGVKKIVATYEGNENYTSQETSVMFKIVKKETKINISVDNTNYGEPINIDITLTDNNGKCIDGNVILLFDNNRYNVTIYNGKGNLIINSASAGLKSIISAYMGNDNYKASSFVTNFIINKANAKMDISINNCSLGEDTIIDVNLTGVNGEKLSGAVIVIINNQKYIVKVVDGVGQQNIGNLIKGNYSATATWIGNLNYTETNASCKFNVDIDSLKLTIHNLTKYYSNNESLIISLTMGDTPIPDKSITIKINGISYIRVTNSKGIISLPLNLLPGTYTVSASYSDILTANATVNILNTITADDLEKLYLNDAKFYAAFVDSYGNPLRNTLVKFNVNGIFYERLTNDEGTSELNIKLKPNNYIITSYNPITGEAKSNKISVLSTIYSSDLEKIYHSSDKFEVTLVDSNNNILPNLTVKFNINGVIYTKITDEYGNASLNINLDAGEYIITMYNSITGEMKSNIIKVVPSINSTNTTLYYHSGDKFSAVFFNSAGELLINETVSFNINGVIYNRVTDNNGIASLTINLDAGEYDITSFNSVTGEYRTNKLYVKPVLIGEDLVKTVYENKSFEVVVLDTHGKPLSGETVAININGVIYNKITNEYGVARLAINLGPGEYIATSTWNDSITSNTILVTN